MYLASALLWCLGGIAFSWGWAFDVAGCWSTYTEMTSEVLASHSLQLHVPLWWQLIHRLKETRWGAEGKPQLFFPFALPWVLHEASRLHRKVPYVGAPRSSSPREGQNVLVSPFSGVCGLLALFKPLLLPNTKTPAHCIPLPSLLVCVSGLFWAKTMLGNN